MRLNLSGNVEEKEREERRGEREQRYALIKELDLMQKRTFLGPFCSSLPPPPPPKFSFFFNDEYFSTEKRQKIRSNTCFVVDTFFDF